MLSTFNILKMFWGKQTSCMNFVMYQNSVKTRPDLFPPFIVRCYNSTQSENSHIKNLKKHLFVDTSFVHFRCVSLMFSIFTFSHFSLTILYYAELIKQWSVIDFPYFGTRGKKAWKWRPPYSTLSQSIPPHAKYSK